MNTNSEGEPISMPVDVSLVLKANGRSYIKLTPEMIVFGSDPVGSTGIKPSVHEMDAYCRKIRAESLVQSKLCKMERYLKAHRHELALRGQRWERRFERYRKFLEWEYKVRL